MWHEGTPAQSSLRASASWGDLATADPSIMSFGEEGTFAGDSRRLGGGLLQSETSDTECACSVADSRPGSAAAVVQMQKDGSLTGASTRPSSSAWSDSSSAAGLPAYFGHSSDSEIE